MGQTSALFVRIGRFFYLSSIFINHISEHKCYLSVDYAEVPIFAFSQELHLPVLLFQDACSGFLACLSCLGRQLFLLGAYPIGMTAAVIFCG